MPDPRLENTPLNANEVIQDRIIRHSLFLEGLKNRQARLVLAELQNNFVPDVRNFLNLRLTDGFLTTFNTQRLESLIQEFDGVLNNFGTIVRGNQQELLDLAADEAVFLQNVLAQSLAPQVVLNTPSTEQIVAAVLNKPFDGRTLEQWYERLEAANKDRLNASLRRGIIEGRTTGQIVSDVVNQGVLGTTRKQTEAVVRTALQHAADAARENVALSNADVLKGEVWVATLDTRTCPTCQGLDGKLFDTDKGVRPPVHVNCRCARSPVTKSFRELGIDADDLEPEMRASMNGAVPADLTYNQWLRRQSASIQDEALGVTRGKLFRSGGLDVTDFVNRNNVERTLDDIRKLEPDAFRRAGLQ